MGKKTHLLKRQLARLDKALQKMSDARDAYDSKDIVMSPAAMEKLVNTLVDAALVFGDLAGALEWRLQSYDLRDRSNRVDLIETFREYA